MSGILHTMQTAFWACLVLAGGALGAMRMPHINRFNMYNNAGQQVPGMGFAQQGGFGRQGGAGPRGGFGRQGRFGPQRNFGPQQALGGQGFQMGGPQGFNAPQQPIGGGFFRY